MIQVNYPRGFKDEGAEAFGSPVDVALVHVPQAPIAVPLVSHDTRSRGPPVPFVGRPSEYERW